jgi:benzodiazapine receptor
MRMEPKKVRSVLVLLVSLGLCFGAGWVGSRFPPGEWYDQLEKPSWNPPNWVFAPVWTALYFSMGLAAWLVWRRSGLAKARVALSFYVAQLVVNAMWSWLFFGLHRPGTAFAEIVLLWVLVLSTLLLFWRRVTFAGALFIPYLIWVSFAAALNFSLWRLNV